MALTTALPRHGTIRVVALCEHCELGIITEPFGDGWVHETSQTNECPGQQVDSLQGEA
jgi:hypothetical protein